MSILEIVLGLAPIIGLLAFVIFIIVSHATSDPHGLNKRGSGGSHFFGGSWKDYNLNEDLAHPDDPLEVEPRQKTRKPRRKNRRSRRK